MQIQNKPLEVKGDKGLKLDLHFLKMHPYT